MLFLNVPYAEKDQARELGAKWDAGSKKWYVPDGTLATPFERWMQQGAADKLLKVHGKPLKAAERKGPLQRASKRQDDAAGVIVIGENYRPAESATGLPWA